MAGLAEWLHPDLLLRFIEHAPVAIAMFDTEMRYLGASARWRSEYRLEGMPLEGRSHYDLFPELPDHWKAVHRRCLAGATERADEELFVRADGTHQWIRWEVQPWRRDADHVGGLVIFTEEMTQRKETEVRLADSEQGLRIALEASGAGVWSYDAVANRGTWDDTFQAAYGWPHDHPRGFEHWVAAIHPDDRPDVLARIEAVRHTPGDDTWDFEFRSLRPDGTVAWHHGRGRAERDAAGRLQRLSGLDLDVTVRKQAEADFRALSVQQQEDAEIRRLLLETAVQGIVSVDSRGTIVTANRALETMFGYDPGQLVGQPVDRLVPSALTAPHAVHRADYFASPRPRPMGVGLDLVGQRQDGSTFPIEISLNHAPSPTGGTAVAFVTDITQRKQGEQALRDHARLASLRADVGAILAKPSPLEDVLQETAAALVAHLGVSFFRIWTLNESDGVLELQASAGRYTHRNGPHARVPIGQFTIGRIAARRVPQFSNDVAHDPEIGDPAWAQREGMVAFAGYPLLVEERVVGVMATFATRALDPVVRRDLSAIADLVAQCIERKRVERALHENAARLDQALDAAAAGTWSWDPITDQMHGDARTSTRVGMLPGQPLSLAQFLARVYPADRPLLAAAFEHACRADGPSNWDLEYRRVLPDGRLIWVQSVARTERDATGRAARVAGISLDISARKASEEEVERSHIALEERTAELEARSAQLSRVASELVLAEQRTREGIAKTLHDGLQQILFGARMKLGRALKRATDGTAVDADLLARTLGDLDEGIRAARSLSVELVPPSLHESGLPGALPWLGDRMCEQYGLTVDVSADPAADVDARDLRVLLFESVRELLFNAVKHAQVDTVRVELMNASNDELVIVVSDQGVGFDPARVTTTGPDRRGGLGLFSVRERVALLGGRVIVESAPGQGTRCTLIAPRRTADAVPPPPRDRVVDAGTPKRSRPAAGGPLRILLVDDHAVVRAGIRELLVEHPELQVVAEATTGREAIARADDVQPDIIVMDVAMPQVDGIAATREIHGRHPDVQIVGLSTHDHPETERLMRDAGAVAYFTKGDHLDRLLAFLSAAHNARATVET